MVETFSFPRIKNISISPSQNVTGNNKKWTRLFWEVKSSLVQNKNHWIFYSKGGGYRKWYGNLTTIIDWSKDARLIYEKGDGKHASQIIPKKYWYKKGITWGLITSSLPSFREMPEGATFDKGGSTIIVKSKEYKTVLGLLNSNVFLKFAAILNPTLNFQVRDIQNMPIISNPSQDDQITKLVDLTIKISQSDWNCFENAWDFHNHPLIDHIAEHQKSPPAKFLTLVEFCDKYVPIQFRRLIFYGKLSKTR
ncbi:BREX-1 system adenine-specific DNA-methyltransferase PglX [Lacticaseibacillus rhamnosus]|nr:BREX-1 system adenine-specific DNA-methyltransferase PglX [Lacticaseibacillus rhamnosus]